MMNEEKYIRDRVHGLYYDLDVNCARTTMICISELLGVTVQPQTMDAALGLHGCGGYRGQCGLVEGAIMMLGIIGREKGKTEEEIVKACYNYADAFTNRWGSLRCRELRPGGFNENDPPHMCEGLTGDTIVFALDYIKKWIGE